MVEKGRQREATSCIGGVGVAAERLEVLNISSGGGVKGTELVVSNVSIFIYIPVPLNWLDRVLDNDNHDTSHH